VKKDEGRRAGRLNDDLPASAISGPRLAFVAALVAAGAISLFISPMALPLFAIYSCLGLVAGFLQLEDTDDLGAFVGLGLIVLGTSAGPTWLTQVAPQWNAAWWQPGVIALAAMGLVHLTRFVFARLRGRQDSRKAQG
jgi:hypothetical protein